MSPANPDQIVDIKLFENRGVLVTFPEVSVSRQEAEDARQFIRERLQKTESQESDAICTGERSDSIDSEKR